MRWSRIHRGYVAAAVAGLGFAILVTARNYVCVQAAHDADAFRLAVGHDRSRVAAAAVIDIAFAATYALLSTGFVEQHALIRLGTAIVIFGAASDIAENVLTLVGVTGLEHLTNDLVEAMRICGFAKWIGIVVGTVVLAAGHARRRSRSA